MKSKFSNLRAKRLRNQLGTATIAEFVTSLFCLLCIVMFPLINLVFLATAAATGFLVATQAASAAAEQAGGLSSMLSSAAQSTVAVCDSGLGRFAHLKPVQGIEGSGVDIYFHVTSVASDKTQIYGPNSAPPTIDTTSNVYECEARSHFLVSPFINLSAVPFIGKVPMVGQSVEICFSSMRMVEDPMSLSNGSGTDNSTNNPAAPPSPIPPGQNHIPIK